MELCLIFVRPRFRIQTLKNDNYIHSNRGKDLSIFTTEKAFVPKPFKRSRRLYLYPFTHRP